MSSSPKATPGDEKSSPPDSPESPSTKTFVKSQRAHDPEDCERWEEAETSLTLDAAGQAARTATAIVTEAWSLGSHAGTDGEATNASHEAGGPVGMGVKKEETPALRSGRTQAVVAFTQNQREELRDLEGVASSLSAEPGTHQDTYVARIEAPALTASWANNGGTGGFDGRDEAVLAVTEAQQESTSSAEGSPARTSPSPESAEASPASGADSSSSSPESLSLFDPDGFSSRTYQVSSLATAVGTSESCLGRWPSSGTAWRGGLSTAATSECRSVDGECSSSEPSLTEILEPPQSVPERYSLSARAARGILRRAQKRGRVLPPHLLDALTTVASQTPSDPSPTADSEPPT